MTTDADKYEVLLAAVREALAASYAMSTALDNNAPDLELTVLLRAENRAVARLAELSGYKKGDKP